MWYDEKNNLLSLAKHLHDNGEWDGKRGISNLLYFFQKPWKYDSEWEEFQKSKRNVKCLNP